MKPYLQCAEQEVSRSNLTKYCACHAERLTYLVLITYETSFTVRGATGVTIQPHQILRLPRKIELQNFWQNLWKQMKRHFQCGADPTMIREWSDHDPSMIREWKRKPQPASQPRLLFDLTTSIFYWKIQRFAPNLTFKPSPNTAPATKSHTWTSPSTAPATKSDTWTSPSTAPATKNDTWTSPNTAPATKNDTWTSPNTAPATKNDSTAVSSSHMKRHLQCAEQQVSRSNLTKYCACHAETLTYLVLITYEYVIYSARSHRCHDPTSPNTAPATQNWIAKFLTKSLKTDETSFPMRGRSDHDPRMIRPWSEHDPRMKTQTATRLATEVTFRPHHEHFLLKNTTFRAQSYIQTFTKYCACHEKSHLNVTKYCACHEKWHLNFTKYCACHEKWHLNFTKYCTCHEKWHLNFTKYCTCHEKWLDCSTLLDSTLLDSTLLDSTLLDSTLLDSTLLDSTLLDSTLRDTILLDSTLLDSTLLDSTLLDSTLLDSTLRDTILLDSTLLDSTLRDTILLDSTLLDSTLLDSTLLDSTLLDSTLLDSSLLDLTLLRCHSYIGSFWAKLPLISENEAHPNFREKTCLRKMVEKPP